MDLLDFYHIDLKYVRDLAKRDGNVLSVSPQRGKESRPFLGVVVLISGHKYCIPLTSPKEKFRRKSAVDFIKIFDNKQRDSQGQQKLIGVLNINNMIPVKDDLIHKVDIRIHKKDRPEIRRKKHLMQNQLRWCRDNSKTIVSRANKVYGLVVNQSEKNRNLVRRSVDFEKAEQFLLRRSEP